MKQCTKEEIVGRLKLEIELVSSMMYVTVIILVCMKVFQNLKIAPCIKIYFCLQKDHSSIHRRIWNPFEHLLRSFLRK